MVSDLPTLKRNLGEISGVTQKYEGALSKTANAIEAFMKTEKPFGNFMRRIVYASGGFRVINKAFIAFRTSGKIYDKTVGTLVNRNSVLGKSFKVLSKIKIPNFAERLGGMVKGVNGVGKLALTSQYSNKETLGSALRGRMAKGLSDRGESIADFIKPMVKRGKKVIGFIKKTDWVAKSKGLVIGTLKLLKFVLSKAFNFFVLSLLTFVAIGAFIKIFWKAIDGVRQAFIEPFEGYFGLLKEQVMIIWEGIKTIFSFFTGDASFTEMAFAILDIMFSFITIIFQVGKRLIIGLFNVVVKVAENLIGGVIDWFMGLKLKTQLKYIGAIAAGILLWLFSVPVIVPAIILGALYMFGRWFIKKFDILAGGGTVSSPLQLVGEKGPEIASLPKGTRVFSNRQSRGMVSNSGTQINNYITINARDTSDGEMRRIANKISSMVNNKINRSTSSRTLG